MTKTFEHQNKDKEREIPPQVSDRFASDDPMLWSSMDRAAMMKMVMVAHDLNAALEHALTRRHPFNARCLACQNIARAQADYKKTAPMIFKR